MSSVPPRTPLEWKESPRPRLGVFKFASCDGCQLSILDCEDELLTLAERVEVAFFREAIRRPLEGAFEIALVEGSVSTPEQEEAIRDIRRRSRFLVCLGACASHGGIQALRNFGSTREALAVVYATPHTIATLEHSRPVSDYVTVDLELPGCPINKRQLLDTLAQMLVGSRPKVDRHSLCLDCKRRGLVCVLVAQGAPCMGPVTSAGCGVLCPSYDRPCFSCFGPAEQPNATALGARFADLGLAPGAIHRLFRTFYATAPEFEEVSRSHADGTS
jgi:coenzyme F420-reducing hydrogenase gamma subunit